MSGEGGRKPAVISVDSEDPPAMSCGWCGWTPRCSGTPGPLLWSVIKHWLTEHWEFGWDRPPVQRDHQ